jgi:uncharacterized membrane protein YfcA
MPRAVWKIALEGLAVGVLTGLVGVGGGFLIVPALVLLGGLSLRAAVATSLPIIALKSLSGFFKYLAVLDAQGIDVAWNVVAVFIVLGSAGTLAGNLIGTRVPQRWLRRGFAIFLMGMAGFVLMQEAPRAFRAPAAVPEMSPR